MRPLALLLCVLTALSLAACQSTSAPQARTSRYAPEPFVKITHPEWSRDAVIYQLNTRQFTPEGTFAAAERELPRLADMGVDIIWLMPIHPIGEVNRKGTLGSPYSVKDYRKVNPEFGTLDDLRSFVDAAHDQGLYVILDWVANHTAWDNWMVEEHPEWYETDWDGDYRPTPWWDWSDIIDLDYSQTDLREYMAKSMIYWVRDVGVDGFRADVAGYVPLDFWEDVRTDLDAIKPVFMLAEWDQRDVHARAFDATYAWGWKDAAQAVARGEGNAKTFFGYYSGNESAWPEDAMRMVYTANHDQNSWDGTAPEIYGPAYRAMIVLSFTGEGIPLIYNGQEAFNEKRLEFFEKDPIVWREHEIEDLFRSLIELKTETSALWNGAAGARMVPVVNSRADEVLSFTRMDENGGVLVMINMTGNPQSFELVDGPFEGQFRDFETGVTHNLTGPSSFSLISWGYKVLVRKTE